jgi:hypothetical protein
LGAANAPRINIQLDAAGLLLVLRRKQEARDGRHFHELLFEHPQSKSYVILFVHVLYLPRVLHLAPQCA